MRVGLVLAILSVLFHLGCGDKTTGRTNTPTGSACEPEDQCEGGSVCFDGICRAICQSAGDCALGRETCEGQVCLPSSNLPCTDNGDCDQPPTCRRAGTCTVTGCVYDTLAGSGTPCPLPGDTTVPSGVCDESGACVEASQLAANGESCGTSSDCASNHCQNSTCCSAGETCCSVDAQCGLCMKCGPQGACVAQTTNEDLKNECDPDFGCGSGYCDGAGACQLEATGRDCGVCRRCDGAGQCLTNSLDHDDCGTCRKCQDGNCAEQLPTEDLKDECTADAGCGTGFCSGANGACDYEVTDTACGDCLRCNGTGSCIPNSTTHEDCDPCWMCSNGACVMQSDGQDLKGLCGAFSCSSTIAGYSGGCYTYASATANNGDCVSGACATHAQACTGTGSLLTPCPSSGCRRCQAGTPSSARCWDDFQRHGCLFDEICVNGTCTWGGTCPIVYSSVDGQFLMETDVYPSGKLGLKISSGFRKPYPHDNYLLRYVPTAEAGSLELRLVEERNETNYLDQVRLYTVDVPEDRTVVSEILSVLPADNVPPQDLLHTVARTMANPVSTTVVATGEDVSAALSATDDQYVSLNSDNNVFDWQTLEVDLGDLSEAPQIKVVIDARVVFPTTSEGYSLARTLDPTNLRTRLEVQDGDGNWVVVPHDTAILTRPKEFPRLHVMDFTDVFTGSNYKMRLSYLYLTYINAIFVDVTIDEPVTVTEVPFESASLAFHGFSAKSNDTPNFEFIYDQPGDRMSVVMPGAYTAFGDVTTLLEQIDDMFVIFGNGDEVQVRFTDPGPAPIGKNRRFVLYSNGYYKNYKTEISHTVEPLPFAAMSNFPYDEAVESYPDDGAHQQYRTEWNTRIVE